ncbi:odorant receptor 13a-like isoform X1 [Neodiprion lecontei]|uniref:Odorant receptor n=2 Tax=Neodiprion lecontei TaxID=441921 RepID=A0ABM3GP99_NEOLC|nr:odorant receptor 13a-like isoform X1 [Neodiprion lecontei]
MDEIRSSNEEHFRKELIFEGVKMYERYVTLHRRLLQPVGLWPRKARWNNLTCCIYEANAFVNISWMILVSSSQYFSIWDARDNFFEVMEIISAMTTAFLIIHKAFTLLFKRSKIREIDDTIRELWIDGWCRHNASVRRQMTMVAGVTKTLTLIYLSLIIITVINFAVSPMVSLYTQRAANLSEDEIVYVLPYLAQFPGVDIRNQTNYTMCYIASSIVSIPIILYAAGTDIFYISYITQISLQFDLLTLEISELFDEQKTNKSPSPSRVEKSKIQKFAFKKCVQKHQKLISSGRIMEQLFSQILFGICVVSTVSMCAVMFETVVASHNQHGNTTQFALYLIFEVTEVFIYCWFGNILVDKSMLVCQEAYCTKWYDADTILQKDLMMVMTRAQQPVYVSACGFVVISLNVCTKILNTAASYFTLIRKMY